MSRRLGFAFRPRRSFRPGLLTYSTFFRRDVALRFDDCGVFDPARCAAPFLVAQGDTCRPSKALRRFSRVRRVDGVLVARAHDHRALLFGGRRWGYVQRKAQVARTFSLARRLARVLERVDGRRLGPPHLPATLRERVTARLRSFVRRC